MQPIPPTPLLPTRFTDESLLLATEPIFDVDLGDDDSWFDDEPTSAPHASSSKVSTLTGTTTRGGRDGLGNQTLDLDAYLPMDDVELVDDQTVLGNVLDMPLLIGRGEKGVEDDRPVEPRTRSVSSASSSSIQLPAPIPNRDDLFARRLSQSHSNTSRPVSPLLTSVPISSPLALTAALPQDSHSTTFSRSHPEVEPHPAPCTSFSSDEIEVSEVKMAWRSKMPGAIARMESIRGFAAAGSVQKHGTPKRMLQPSSTIARYLAKSTTSRNSQTANLSDPIRSLLTVDQMTGSHQTATLHKSKTRPTEQYADRMDPISHKPLARPKSSLQPSHRGNTRTTMATELISRAPGRPGKPSARPRPTPRSTSSSHDLTTASSTDHSSLVSSKSATLSDTATVSNLVQSNTVPSNVLDVPLPTLTELSDSDTSVASKDKRRTSKSEMLLSFFTGFLMGPGAVEPVRDVKIVARDNTDGGIDDEEVLAEADEDMGDPDEYVDDEQGDDDVPMDQRIPPIAVIHPPQRIIHSPSRKGVSAHYIPLTRPLAPFRAALQPSRSVASLSSNASRLITAAPRKDHLRKIHDQLEPARVKYQNRGMPPSRPLKRSVTTSEFASSALAKLPPPGKGSTSSGRPVTVGESERARDLATRRKVFELRPHTTIASVPMPKTVPVAGRTPGKASRARANQREQYEKGLRQRMVEKEREKRDREKMREKEEEDEYQRKRKETVIWAKPVPEMYKSR